MALRRPAAASHRRPPMQVTIPWTKCRNLQGSRGGLHRRRSGQPRCGGEGGEHVKKNKSSKARNLERFHKVPRVRGVPSHLHQRLPLQQLSNCCGLFFTCVCSHGHIIDFEPAVLRWRKTADSDTLTSPAETSPDSGGWSAASAMRGDTMRRHDQRQDHLDRPESGETTKWRNDGRKEPGITYFLD
jgi:hypothetical protein